MTKCSYCGKEYGFFKGLTLITNSGHMVHFCSSKCRKNSKMRRSDKRKWSRHRVEVEGEKKE